MAFTSARDEWADGSHRLPLTGRDEKACNGDRGQARKPDERANGNGRLPATRAMRAGIGHGLANGNGNGHANGNGRLSATSTRLDWRAIVDDHVGRSALARNATVSVIIPALNEEQNLPHVLPRIPGWVDEVVLVDGLSDDNTVALAASLVPNLRVVEQMVPGKGAALQAGFRAARGDIVITLDADGSTDPAEIPVFVGALLAGADYAKGSRFLQGGGTADMSLLRRAGNWGLRSLVRIGFGGRFTDLCYGYNAFWRETVVPVIDVDADGFEIETMMNVRVLAANLKVVEVPSYEAARIHGKSHLKTWRDGFRVLRTIVREWRQAHRPGRRPDAVGPPRPQQTPDLARDELELEALDLFAD